MAVTQVSKQSGQIVTHLVAHSEETATNHMKRLYPNAHVKYSLTHKPIL